MQHPVSMYYAENTPYPVEIRNGRVSYILQILACLLALFCVLAYLSVIGDAERSATFLEQVAAQKAGREPVIVAESLFTKIKHIVIYISCIAFAALMALAVITSGILAFKNPVVIKFDAQGILFMNINPSLFMNINPRNIKDVRINWSDVSSVDIYSYKRIVRHKNRTVSLILHDNKIFKKGAVQDISHHPPKARKIKHNMRGTIILKYMGYGMGFTHDEYFEFIKSELSKYQSNYPVTPTSRKRPIKPSKRLFG